MPRKTEKSSSVVSWRNLDKQILASTPQLHAILSDEEGFISLHLKLKDDRTVLAVLKRYGPDGGPLVCFGSGYGVSGCLVGLEGTVAAGRWKVDKPWDGKPRN